MNINFSNSLHNIDKVKWKFFLRNHKNCNIFQSIEMHDFWSNQNKTDAFIFFFESDNKECLAFCTGVIMHNGNILKPLLSKRALIIGGPLFHENLNDDNKSFIIDKIDEYLREKSIYCEYRNLFDESDLKHIFLQKNWHYIPYLNYLINLDCEDCVFSKFDNEKRRQIRKAIREGVDYTFEKNRANAKSVYNILYKIYINRAKKPLPKFAYFIDLLKLENAGIVAVKYNNEIIGGGFFLMDKHTIYDWYRGGLDTDFKHQYPSSVADWAIMKYGIEHEKKKFDFMGAGIKGEEYGVRTYKSRFGGELVEYGRFLKVYKPVKYNIALKGLNLSKRIIELKNNNFKKPSI